MAITNAGFLAPGTHTKQLRLAVDVRMVKITVQIFPTTAVTFTTQQITKQQQVSLS